MKDSSKKVGVVPISFLCDSVLPSLVTGTWDDNNNEAEEATTLVALGVVR